jgi:hypothetical protein
MRCNGRGTSAWSGPALAAHLALAATLLADPGLAGSHTLRWRDRSANEGGFLVERRRDVREPFIGIAAVGANVASFVDAVDPAIPYCYRVRAFNDGGLSAPSNEACAPGTGVVPSPGALPPKGPAAGEPSGAISAGLIASPTVVQPGTTVRFSVVAANPGPPTQVDIHFGVVLPPQLGIFAPVDCPGGPSDVMLVFAAGFARTDLACLSTTFGRGASLFPGVPVPGQLAEQEAESVLGFVWPGELPPGVYTFVIGVTAAGHGQSGGWLVLVGQTLIAVPGA